jgi:hypothetical protein
MLVEDLLALPIGTDVFGDVGISTKIPGVVASMENGRHYICWDDGFASFPFGSVRAYDEYIAAHIELQPVRCGLSQFEAGSDKGVTESKVHAKFDHSSSR